jgi:broad specificity phosphatase PhoE
MLYIGRDMKRISCKLAVGILVGLGAIVQGGCASEAMQTAPIPAAKSVFVVRHFQKGEGADPSLTAEGSANAQRLAAMLSDKGVTAVFATPTKRAMETAAPLAAQLGLAVAPYDPNDPQALLAAVRATSGSALVVGHSNTVPDLVAMFGGAKPAPLSDSDYGTVYVVEADGRVAVIPVR